MAGAVVRSEGLPLGVQHLGGARLRDTGHPAVLAVRVANGGRNGRVSVRGSGTQPITCTPAARPWKSSRPRGRPRTIRGASLGMSAAVGGTTGGRPFGRVRVTKRQSSGGLVVGRPAWSSRPSRTCSPPAGRPRGQLIADRSP